MPNDTILIVEDDRKISTLLRKVMEGEGYGVRIARNAAEAMQSVERDLLSLITLDIQLGTDDGFELARRIRGISDVPIIMVTGKNDVIDRVVGLEIGADDYITKPFHVREVIARVRSVLRRAELVHAGRAKKNLSFDTEEQGAVSLCFDGMTTLPDRLELRDRCGKDRSLTSGEFKLLMVFLERPKRVLSRDQLMDLTGGQEWTPLDRTIDNQIARLRKKIERDQANPKLIKTIRGIGYTLACDVQVLPSSPGPLKSA
jgi:DNA-binding response OmpR family regulator